jgi:hypothetical protein
MELRYFLHLNSELTDRMCLHIEHPRANEVSERFTDGAVEDGGVGCF